MVFLKYPSYLTYFFAATAAILGVSLLSDRLRSDHLMAIPRVVIDNLTWTRAIRQSSIDDHQYQVQIFSKDPLIMAIHPFITNDEIAHLLHVSENNFTTSLVYGGEESRFDPNKRISESAILSHDDPVVLRVEQRAKNFQGWRGNRTVIQRPTLQRYQVGGFFDYHYDWEPKRTSGNRITTFMVYLVADCEGGGTNFPYLTRPNGTEWCNIIECTEDGMDGFQGVTFKPRTGSAIFWENFYPNGSGHEGVYHAGLPVKSGVKVGLNIWSWDFSWRSDTAEADNADLPVN